MAPTADRMTGTDILAARPQNVTAPEQTHRQQGLGVTILGRVHPHPIPRSPKPRQEDLHAGREGSHGVVNPGLAADRNVMNPGLELTAQPSWADQKGLWDVDTDKVPSQAERYRMSALSLSSPYPRLESHH